MKIQAPTHCPSCSSTLEWRNDLLYCENTACEGKSSQKLEHFAKTLKIKGLGPATIDKLQLESIFDIYEMNLDLLTELFEFFGVVVSKDGHWAAQDEQGQDGEGRGCHHSHVVGKHVMTPNG